MTETLPPLDMPNPVAEGLQEPALPPAEAYPALDPEDWRRMKQTDLPTIEAQIAQGTQRLVDKGEKPYFFLNNFPDLLPGGRRTVGKHKERLQGDDPRLGHAALRRGDPAEWTKDEKLLRSDRMKGMTNGEFFRKLAAAVRIVGMGKVAGLTADDFIRLNGLRAIGKLAGDDVAKHYAFEIAVYKWLRQKPYGFSHDDLWH